MSTQPPFFSAARLMSLASVLLLSGCERPPVISVQHGYAGTRMVQDYTQRTHAQQPDQHNAPESTPPLPDDGPKAGQVYQNVKVLGDLSVGQFTRLMANMTAWIAPEQGCAYCHNPANLAEDSKYTKVVARKMVEMTQHINT
ncbi:MAG: photosynthetic reaction center cytochrome PufC, partial [Betaproteobacteria bacterium]